MDGEVAVQSLATAPVIKQFVDPYNVQGEIGVDGVTKAINYLNLVEEFGTRLLLRTIYSSDLRGLRGVIHTDLCAEGLFSVTEI